MSSLLNNSARLYSLSLHVDNKTLKVDPKLNTFETLFKIENGVRKHKWKSNDHIKTEVDFEDALKRLTMSDYVKVLVDKGTFVINVKSTIEPKPTPEVEPIEEPEPVEEPESEVEEEPEPEPKKSKRGRPKKKKY